MKISASFNSSNQSLGAVIERLEKFHVDYLHIDAFDTGCFDTIKEIRTHTNIPIDLHIISEKPASFFEGILENEIEIVSFQYEPLTDKINFPDEMKDSKIGLAIGMDTPAEVFDEYSKDCSTILLFSADEPGKSGGGFDPDIFPKIHALREKYPNKFIHVDGGITDDVSFALKNAGVNVIVVGSYLFSESHVGQSLFNLHSSKDQTLQIEDIMKRKNQLDLLNENNLSVKNVLEKMDQSNLGIVLITDQDSKLKGIISSGDIRRTFLSNVDDLNQVDISEAINENPLTIDHNATISEMLEKIRKTSTPILYVPVIDESDHTLIGMVSFHNLVKGEL